MESSTRIGPKDVFLHLLSIIALYVSAGSFITLLFQYINALIPDPASAGYSLYSGPLRFAISSIIIIFPGFLGVSYLLERSYGESPERRRNWLKRWLTYFTLFLAAVIMAGDLVMLVYNFIGGELTVRFVLKALAFFLVAGTIFVHYLREVRRFVAPSKLFVWSVSAVVAVATIGSFFLIGSPFAAHDRQLDQQRINNLQSIQWEVVNYWQRKQALPTTLNDIADPLRGFIVPSDPETGEAYGYQVKGQKSFELCATFATDSQDVPLADQSEITKPISGVVETWGHGVGETCFSRTIDSDLYPPYPKS